MYRNKKGQFARKALNTVLYFFVTIVILVGLMEAVAQPTQAEYHHCMVTTTDKTICNSVKP